MKPQSSTVFDVEPFGHELKAEWLRRNEEFSVFSNSMWFNGNNRGFVTRLLHRSVLVLSFFEELNEE